jgi:hypothetical protein
MTSQEQLANLYATLLSAARTERTLTYSEVSPIVGLNMELPADREEIGRVLEEICRAEVRHGRPMLSSVVVHKNEFGVGHGFYRLGKELGLVQAREDELAFLVRQLKETFATWASTKLALADTAVRQS